MREFWTIPTANMMYTTSQNYTNMVVGKHGIQTFEVNVVVVVVQCGTKNVSFKEVDTNSRNFQVNVCVYPFNN
jgi:hypothetical protein